MSTADAVRQIGVSELAYHRWRKDYGGMGTDQLKQLKQHVLDNQPSAALAK